ncbi:MULTISPECIES: AAA family ATPase [unclassified Bradyrhizobium]|uniref:AAA family ATPase n=1 Tax=unclassified Bradyrhizobium TaxID=2631580 RepID=UPI0028E9B546|nr:MULTISPECIES: AAA family ATPase [unclassified Bradyrhizobium]
MVTRLVVQRGRRAVYDERFHAGVNVIRGANSSGKSTILNFIFYGLGGDLADWSEYALLCERVELEVQLNGKTATLSREVAQQSGQPMEIFGGDYDSAQKAPRAEWVRYPYRRSASQESFSQALFRLLHIPEVASDVSGNLTIHQLLRLLYADQLSPVDNLFRHESRFDSPAVRDAIARLLAGAFEPALYDNEIKLRDLTREFDAKSGELRSLFSVIGSAEHGLTLEWVAAQRRSLEEEGSKLQSQIEEQERELYVTAKDTDQLTLKAQERAYEEVQRTQAELSKVRQERDALALSIADSSAFIASLEHKLAALTDASTTAAHIGDIRFSLCPACYAPIENSSEHSSVCHLCKSPFDSERARGRIVAMINDTALQIKQSRMLQQARNERSSERDRTLRALDARWREASARLTALQRLPSTELRERLRSLHRQSGYVARQIEDLDEKTKVISLIEQIAARKNELNDTISRIKEENERLRASQQRRLEHAYTRIADEIRTLLQGDLKRQDSFVNPRQVQLDFAANRISVDGHTYFSASSRAILRSSFFLGFFAAATKDSQFRHPRFVMLDTIEDKGMEEARSHNFQRQILRASNDAKVEHQIIYATAMIAPDLDDPKFTVGKASNLASPTLEVDS